MKTKLEEIKEALSTVLEGWEVWRIPSGGVEIFEKDSRAVIAHSYPTDANGKFDGAVIAKFPEWLASLISQVEEMQKTLEQARQIIEGFRIWEEMNPSLKTYNKSHPALVDDDYETYRNVVKQANDFLQSLKGESK